MNKFKKMCLVALSVLSISLYANENEAESENKKDKLYAPVVVSLFGNEIFMFSNRDVVSNCAVGLVGSTIHQVNGIQSSGAYNVTNKMNGGQHAGIFNVNTTNTYGYQAAGLFNVTGGTVGGAQFAGGINIAAGELYGYQGAGLVNIAGGENGGGLQTAGILNIKKGDFKGAQFGLINVCTGECGFQFGLINISKSGVLELGTSYTSNEYFRYSFSTGPKLFYTVFGLMTDNPFVNGNCMKAGFYDNFATFAGFGSRQTMGILNIDVEALYNNVYYRDSEDCIRSAGYMSGRLSMGLTLGKVINIFAGYTAGFEHPDWYDSSIAFDHTRSHLASKFNNGLMIHHSVDAGLKIRFNK